MRLEAKGPKMWGLLRGVPMENTCRVVKCTKNSACLMQE